MNSYKTIDGSVEYNEQTGWTFTGKKANELMLAFMKKEQGLEPHVVPYKDQIRISILNKISTWDNLKND
jgi:hypothetical protein